MDEKLSVRLIKALADIWSAIRRLHPDVPGVILLPAPNPHSERNVLGHFAPLRWAPRRAEGAFYHEVVVVAEHLNRPISEILETILHEAGHALNCARGIRDCSRSQYHNQHFKEAAEELGLCVAQVPHYGFAYTTLPPETEILYARETERLAQVLLYRHTVTRSSAPPTPTGTTDAPTTTTGTAPPPKGRNMKAVCRCPFVIRVSRSTLQDTVIRCDKCGQPFELA